MVDFNKLFSGSDKIIKNINYLTELIPAGIKFLHREDEIKDISLKLIPFLNNQRGGNCFIYGYPGTGKTAVTKHTLSEFENFCINNKNKFKFTFTDCDTNRSDIKVMADIIHQISENTKLPKSGLTKNYVVKTFEEILLSGKIKNLTIVLDEIDILINNERTGGSWILYYLSRLKDNSKFNNVNISTIIISNKESFRDKIPVDVKSSFGSDRVDFYRYNALQLKDILYQRSNLAFNKGAIEEGVIEKISAIVIKNGSSDCRQALDILRKCSELAIKEHKDKINVKLVNKAEDFINLDILMKSINKMTLSEKILFFSVLEGFVGLKENDRFYSDDVYEIYYGLCKKQNIDSLSLKRIRDILNEFEKAGLVRLYTKYSSELKKKTTEIEMGYDKKYIQTAYNKLLTELKEEELN